jgi:hypothetical protein
MKSGTIGTGSRCRHLDHLRDASWSGDRQSGCRFGLEFFESGGSVQQPVTCSARGDAAAGLVDLDGPIASPSSLLMCVASTELILLVAALLLLKLGLDRCGPGRMRGVANAGEVERLLVKSPDGSARSGPRARRREGATSFFESRIVISTLPGSFGVANHRENPRTRHEEADPRPAASGSPAPPMKEARRGDQRLRRRAGRR